MNHVFFQEVSKTTMERTLQFAGRVLKVVQEDLGDSMEAVLNADLEAEKRSMLHEIESEWIGQSRVIPCIRKYNTMLHMHRLYKNFVMEFTMIRADSLQSEYEHAVSSIHKGENTALHEFEETLHRAGEISKQEFQKKKEELKDSYNFHKHDFTTWNDTNFGLNSKNDAKTIEKLRKLCKDCAFSVRNMQEVQTLYSAIIIMEAIKQIDGMKGMASLLNQLCDLAYEKPKTRADLDSLMKKIHELGKRASEAAVRAGEESAARANEKSERAARANEELQRAARKDAERAAEEKAEKEKLVQDCQALYNKTNTASQIRFDFLKNIGDESNTSYQLKLAEIELQIKRATKLEAFKEMIMHFEIFLNGHIQGIIDGVHPKMSACSKSLQDLQKGLIAHISKFDAGIQAETLSNSFFKNVLGIESEAKRLVKMVPTQLGLDAEKPSSELKKIEDALNQVEKMEKELKECDGKVQKLESQSAPRKNIVQELLSAIKNKNGDTFKSNIESANRLVEDCIVNVSKTVDTLLAEKTKILNGIKQTEELTATDNIQTVKTGIDTKKADARGLVLKVEQSIKSVEELRNVLDFLCSLSEKDAARQDYDKQLTNFKKRVKDLKSELDKYDSNGNDISKLKKTASDLSSTSGNLETLNNEVQKHCTEMNTSVRKTIQDQIEKLQTKMQQLEPLQTAANSYCPNFDEFYDMVKFKDNINNYIETVSKFNTPEADKTFILNEFTNDAYGSLINDLICTTDRLQTNFKRLYELSNQIEHELKEKAVKECHDELLMQTEYQMLFDATTIEAEALKDSLLSTEYSDEDLNEMETKLKVHMDEWKKMIQDARVKKMHDSCRKGIEKLTEVSVTDQKQKHILLSNWLSEGHGYADLHAKLALSEKFYNDYVNVQTFQNIGIIEKELEIKNTEMVDQLEELDAEIQILENTMNRNIQTLQTKLSDLKGSLSNIPQTSSASDEIEATLQEMSAAGNDHGKLKIAYQKATGMKDKLERVVKLKDSDAFGRIQLMRTQAEQAGLGHLAACLEVIQENVVNGHYTPDEFETEIAKISADIDSAKQEQAASQQAVPNGSAGLPSSLSEDISSIENVLATQIPAAGMQQSDEIADQIGGAAQSQHPSVALELAMHQNQEEHKPKDLDQACKAMVGFIKIRTAVYKFCSEFFVKHIDGATVQEKTKLKTFLDAEARNQDNFVLGLITYISGGAETEASASLLSTLHVISENVQKTILELAKNQADNTALVQCVNNGLVNLNNLTVNGVLSEENIKEIISRKKIGTVSEQSTEDDKWWFAWNISHLLQEQMSFFLKMNFQEGNSISELTLPTKNLLLQILKGLEQVALASGVPFPNSEESTMEWLATGKEMSDERTSIVTDKVSLAVKKIVEIVSSLKNNSLSNSGDLKTLLEDVREALQNIYTAMSEHIKEHHNNLYSIRINEQIEKMKLISDGIDAYVAGLAAELRAENSVSQHNADQQIDEVVNETSTSVAKMGQSIMNVLSSFVSTASIEEDFPRSMKRIHDTYVRTGNPGKVLVDVDKAQKLSIKDKNILKAAISTLTTMSNEQFTLHNKKERFREHMGTSVIELAESKSPTMNKLFNEGFKPDTSGTLQVPGTLKVAVIQSMVTRLIGIEEHNTENCISLFENIIKPTQTHKNKEIEENFDSIDIDQSMVRKMAVLYMPFAAFRTFGMRYSYASYVTRKHKNLELNNDGGNAPFFLQEWVYDDLSEILKDKFIGDESKNFDYSNVACGIYLCSLVFVPIMSFITRTSKNPYYGLPSKSNLVISFDIARLMFKLAAVLCVWKYNFISKQSTQDFLLDMYRIFSCLFEIKNKTPAGTDTSTMTGVKIILEMMKDGNPKEDGGKNAMEAVKKLNYNSEAEFSNQIISISKDIMKAYIPNEEVKGQDANSWAKYRLEPREQIDEDHGIRMQEQMASAQTAKKSSLKRAKGKLL